MGINPILLKEVWPLVTPRSVGERLLRALQLPQLEGDVIAQGHRWIDKCRKNHALRPEQKRALEWLQIELDRLSQNDMRLEERRARTVAALMDGQIPPKPLPPALLHSTQLAGLVYLGVPEIVSTPSGQIPKAQNIVIRPVPWITGELSSLGGAALYLMGDARLRMATGDYDADGEFEGYRAKFIDHSQANLQVFTEEEAPFRRKLSTSYRGRSWNIKKSSICALYPDWAQGLVPDLHREAIDLESKFPMEGEHGLWNLVAMPRGGHLEFRQWDLLNRDKGVWAIVENGVYVGDVNSADHPVHKRTPTFMEDVNPNPAWRSLHFEALGLGKPMRISLGDGSGFVGKPSSHMLIGNREVTIVDPNGFIVRDLIAMGIPFSRVKRIILSHFHFDHMAGLWQLIRCLPHKPELIVQTSSDDEAKLKRGLREDDELSGLCALVDMAVQSTCQEITSAQLLNAVTIVPMLFHQPMKLGAFRHVFFHANHTHPTIGYYIENDHTNEPVLLFTGDTRLDPGSLHAAVRLGVMTEQRARFLANLVTSFLIRGAFVDADAGIAPLHPTPERYVEVRRELQAVGLTEVQLDRVMSRLHCYHETRANVVRHGLQHIGAGWRSALDLSEAMGWRRPKEGDFEDSLLQNGLRRVAVFASLSDQDLAALTRMITFTSYARGQLLMRQGDFADNMMLVLYGAVEVSVKHAGRELVLAVLTEGLFGEAAFRSGSTRNATVKTLTDVYVAELGTQCITFLKAKGIDIVAIDLRRLEQISNGTEAEAPILTDLQPITRRGVCLWGDLECAPAGTAIIEEGNRAGDLFIVTKGSVMVTAERGPLHDHPVQLKRGSVIGEGALMGAGVRQASVICEEDVEYIRLNESVAQDMLARFGGDLNYFLLGLVQTRATTN